VRLRRWQYRIARWVGQHVTWLVALLTLKRMPPFVGAAAIIERDGRILMIHDSAQQQLVLPGGHLRWDESVEMGLQREVWEESGYEIKPDVVFAIYGGSGAPTDRGIIRIVMRAHIVGGHERSSPEGDVEWVDPITVATGPWRDARVIADWINHSTSLRSTGS
jgi:ADP-ribose pyrophosphatase YjhB (NUDIX family)